VAKFQAHRHSEEEILGACLQLTTPSLEDEFDRRVFGAAYKLAAPVRTRDPGTNCVVVRDGDTRLVARLC
jgi:hypothetical protein